MRDHPMISWVRALLTADERAALQLTHHYASGHHDDIEPALDCPATRDEPLGDLRWGEDACDCGLTYRRAAALASVAADRQLLALHPARGVRGGPPYVWACRTCDSAPVPWEVDTPWPCRTLHAVVSRHRHRPGYLEEWAPAPPVDLTPPARPPASGGAHRDALTVHHPWDLLGGRTLAPGQEAAQDAMLLGMGARLDIWRAGVSSSLAYRLRVDPSCLLIESHREHPVRATIQHRDSGARCGCGPAFDSIPPGLTPEEWSAIRDGWTVTYDRTESARWPSS